MNDLLTPLLLIIVLSLIVALIKILNDLKKVNRTWQQAARTPQSVAQFSLFLQRLRLYIYVPIALLIFIITYFFQQKRSKNAFLLAKSRQIALSKFDTAAIWEAPNPLSIKAENAANLIQYGRDLIAHTADYLGPEGIVKPISNGMNCQNCHLEAASKPFGNNYSAVASTYPKFRARSGTAETIYKRVNDCFQRSLNGQPLDSTSREMLAIEAYIKWLGQAVPKGKSPKGVGLLKLNFLNRAANRDSGQVVYLAKCQSCHGLSGEGLAMPEGNNRRYPPLWGAKSYNEAAGLYRLSNFAGYVKANMPFGATYQNPQLTDTEAWDLAAFVNSQPRPKHPFLATDFPKIEGKPFDHPFAPFADSFPESQHKFGPFAPIVDFQKKKTAQKEATIKIK